MVKIGGYCRQGSGRTDEHVVFFQERSQGGIHSVGNFQCVYKICCFGVPALFGKCTGIGRQLIAVSL